MGGGGGPGSCGGESQHAVRPSHVVQRPPTLSTAAIAVSVRGRSAKRAAGCIVFSSTVSILISDRRRLASAIARFLRCTLTISRRRRRSRSEHFREHTRPKIGGNAMVVTSSRLHAKRDHRARDVLLRVRRCAATRRSLRAGRHRSVSGSPHPVDRSGRSRAVPAPYSHRRPSAACNTAADHSARRSMRRALCSDCREPGTSRLTAFVRTAGFPAPMLG